MIYFTSDLHFGHDKPFLYVPRGFENIEEHDFTIVNRWNNIVRDDDDVFILGDIVLGPNQEMSMNYFNALNGRKHIILGNHDSPHKITMYEASLNTDILGWATVIEYNKIKFYLSHFPTETSNFDYDNNLKRSMSCLCGHTHQKGKFWKDNPFVYNVALDAHNCTPVSIEEVINDIQTALNKRDKIE